MLQKSLMHNSLSRSGGGGRNARVSSRITGW